MLYYYYYYYYYTYIFLCATNHLAIIHAKHIGPRARNQRLARAIITRARRGRGHAVRSRTAGRHFVGHSNATMHFPWTGFTRAQHGWRAVAGSAFSKSLALIIIVRPTLQLRYIPASVIIVISYYHNWYGLAVPNTGLVRL